MGYTSCMKFFDRPLVVPSILLGISLIIGLAIVGTGIGARGNSNTITVKNMVGGSQVVVLAPSTQYRKAVDGTSTDVAVGSMVTITGATNSDGSLTAQSVQIRAASSTPATSTK